MYGIIEPDENFPNLHNNKSVLAQCITKELYSKLFWSKTSSGYTVDQAIQIGVDCDDHEIGIFLGDYECIDVFEPLIGPILDKIHPFFDYFDNNVSHVGNLKMIKFDGTQTLKDFVIEYAFHLRRNLRGYSLPPHCTRAERREINRILIYILKQLTFDPSFPHFQLYVNKTNKTNTSKNKDNDKMNKKKGDKKNKKDKKRSSNKSKELEINIDDINDNKNQYEDDEKTPTGKPKMSNKSSSNKKKKDKTKKKDATKAALKNKKKEQQQQPQPNGHIDNDNDEETKDSENIEDTDYVNGKSQVVDLVNIDDATLTELEEMGLAPSREASLTSEYLIGGLSRDFPDARTLFYNQKAMVGAWTNHENHLEMIIQHTRPDLNYVYKKFVDIYVQFRKILKRKEMAWIRHRRLGIVTTSPKHFGTGLSIQCSIRAPHLALHPKFERILNKRSLELIGMSQDIINLETIHTLGRSESIIASDLGNALIDLCRMEKALARNKPIDKLM